MLLFKEKMTGFIYLSPLLLFCKTIIEMFGGLVPLHASITTMLSLSCGWNDLGTVIIMRDSVNYDKHFSLRGGGDLKESK